MCLSSFSVFHFFFVFVLVFSGDLNIDLSKNDENILAFS